MKQIFTDPRFPGVEVHQEGNQIKVYQRDNGRMEEVDSFLTNRGAEPQQRAKDYFDRMSRGQISNELNDRGTGREELPGNPDRDHSDIFNNPQERNKSFDELMSGKVMTSDDVMAAYDRAVAVQDPDERKKVMAQVSQMAQRLESTAQELVRRLLI